MTKNDRRSIKSGFGIGWTSVHRPIGKKQPLDGLLDDFIGAPEEGRRDGEPERPGGFEIDHQLELGRLFDGKTGRLAPFKILSTYPAARLWAIRHQAAAIADEYRSSVHRRQLVPSREFTHSGAVNSENGLGFQSPVKS